MQRQEKTIIGSKRTMMINPGASLAGVDAANEQCWYEIRALAAGRVEIYLYDVIGGQGITAQQFVTDCREAGVFEASAVDLHIHSPGGDVIQSFAIFNTLSCLKVKLDIWVDGVAASMASMIVFLPGATVHMPENAWLMIHKPWGGIAGDSDDIRFIRKHFNVVLERTVRELNGEPCLELEEFAPVKQEIVCSRSFGGRITDYEEMRQAICSYATRAAEKLLGEHQYCRFVSAFVKTSPFALNEPYYGNSSSVKQLTPTQDSRDIIGAATSCLDAIWRDGHRYQKAGIMLGDFFSQGVAQLNLFDDNAPKPNSGKLMEVLDHLNAKDGRGTLYFAGQGIQQQWQMKREMLSPRYTTRYSDLLIVS